MTTTVSDEQRDRLYAMCREAQLREIGNFKIKAEKQKRAAAGNSSSADPAPPKRSKAPAISGCEDEVFEAID